MSLRLPPVSTIPSFATTERAAILDTLFERCVPLHNLSIDLLHNKTFASYNDLIASIGLELTALSESSSTSDLRWLEDIVSAHPRLGAKKVESAQSQTEQAQLQREGEEAAELNALNEEYEKTFPRLRYVTFVDGRGREIIMEDMRKRIANGNIQSERKAAIKAMCDIAADRTQKLS